jgi:leucyl/phenylalanyl-tRNA--protein transferase
MHWLSVDSLQFPHPKYADADGLLAIGGDLSVERLVLAYRWGIFPWFNPEDPILWWHPDPRYVLFPHQLKVSKSMRPYFNQRKFSVTYNRAFPAVMAACGGVDRPGQDGTWISEDMLTAYTALHEAGYAHSVEVWQDDALVGGLYGVAIGRVFFGESMFSLVSNASKFGFITLVQHLTAQGCQLIDCQQGTQHLISMGAVGISRKAFLDVLIPNQAVPLKQFVFG